MFLWYLFLLRLFAVELCIFSVFSQAKIRTLGLVKKCFCWCFLWWYFLLLSYVFCHGSEIRTLGLVCFCWCFLWWDFFAVLVADFYNFLSSQGSEIRTFGLIWFFDFFLWWIFFLLSCVLLHFTLKTRIRNSDPWLSMLLTVFFLVVRVWSLVTKDGIV